MQAGPRERRLFEAARPRLAEAAERELEGAPPPEAWAPVAAVREGERTLVVAGTADDADHLSVLAFDADAADAAVLVHRGAPARRRNDLIGSADAASRGALVAVFRAEPGARAVAYERAGAVARAPVDPESGRCLVLDFDDPRPIDRFVAVEGADGERPVAIAGLPYTPHHIADAWDGHARRRSGAGTAGDRWIADTFAGLSAMDAEELAFAILKGANAERHGRGLAALGIGPLAGAGHWFYDRIESERGIPPENVYMALAMERPELLPEDVAPRFHRLMKRLARRIGLLVD